MISIIVCSINPTQRSAFEANIAQTIGVPYELLIHDNREANWGLCRVYNHYARQSRYETLCFCHEDILFHTPEWGKTIVGFFHTTPNAGVVGFAGSTVKSRHAAGWGSHCGTNRTYLTQHYPDGTIVKENLNPLNEAYSPVAVVDGLALMATKRVWEAYPFDEDRFTRFHLYDLDFTLQVAQQHTNYVCYTIQVEHFSLGSYSKEWLAAMKTFLDKWADKLPFSALPYPPAFMQACERRDHFDMVKREFELCASELSLFKMGHLVLQVPTCKYKFRLLKHLFRALWQNR